MMRKLLVLLLCCWIATTFAQTTHTVDDDGGGDFTTITTALASGTVADGDILSVTGGADNTHTEAGITISRDITIKGQGQSTTIIQAHATEGSASDRVFNVTTSGTDVTFQDMTIRHGATSSTGGGGVFINLGSGATGTATFTNVTISNNQTIGSFNGGGLYIADDITSVTMTDCIISNNTSGDDAGGIYQSGAVNFTMTRCVISNNTTTNDGGGVYIHKVGSTNTLINCIINDNTTEETGSSNDGGGLYLFSGDYILKNCTIYGNKANDGAGIYDASLYNNITLYHCTIANNTAVADGGGVRFSTSTGEDNVVSCIVVDNTAGGTGNDIYAYKGIITNASDADHSWVEDCGVSSTGTCPTFTSTAGSVGAVTDCGNANLKFLDITAGSPAENIGKPLVEDANIPTDDICGGTRNATPDAGSREIGASLPVELVSFTGKNTEAGNLLTWITAAELNNEVFEIERSQDGDPDSYRDWERIGYTQGNGTTQATQAYNYLDNRPLSGINYYRLKQVDFDGAFEYSEVITITMERLNDKTVDIFPNPVSNELNVVNGEGVATIYNVLGQPVMQLAVGSEQFIINTSDLPKGQYILRISQQNGNVISQQFVK